MQADASFPMEPGSKKSRSGARPHLRF